MGGRVLSTASLLALLQFLKLFGGDQGIQLLLRRSTNLANLLQLLSITDRLRANSLHLSARVFHDASTLLYGGLGDSRLLRAGWLLLIGGIFLPYGRQGPCWGLPGSGRGCDWTLPSSQ
jgi:hypothetical protein